MTKATHHQIDSSVHRPPLTVAEAATWMGDTKRHVRRLIQERRIPYVKVGGKVRLLAADLDTWLLDQRVLPVDGQGDL